MTALPVRLAALCTDPAVGGTWLDGGGGLGAFAAFPAQTVEAGDLAALSVLEDVFAGRAPGTWIGHVTYDVGVAALLGRQPRPGRFPGVLLRRFDAWAELEGDALVRICGTGTAVERIRRTMEAARDLRPDRDVPFSGLEPAWPPEVYRGKVQAVLAAIGRGDTYQVNLAQPFRAVPKVPVDPAGVGRLAARLYLGLRRASPAPFGALYGAEGVYVLSNSPETLLELAVEDGRVHARSRPIKGTRPRHPSPELDERAARELAASTKDRAEHVMIVDLVRNDLGRLCVPGTVTADAAPRHVRLPTVHHLETAVRGILRPGVSMARVFGALFPGGSVTGAPKRRTVEIIDELEGRPRGIYCGAIVWVRPGRLVASLPIRTAEVGAFGLEVWAGGGIVADSDPDAELREAVAKTRAFELALEGR